MSCRRATQGSSAIIYGIFCRRRDNKRRHARRRFVSVVSFGVLGSSAQNMVFCAGVATPIVRAVVEVSYVSCRMLSRGSHIVEYYRKIIPKPKIFTDNRTQDSFRHCGVCFYNLFFETNNFDLGSILLSCLVSELQEPPSPGIELYFFRSFDPPMFSSWSQGISMPNLVQIGVSVVEL
jgi:hypothetical protein